MFIGQIVGLAGIGVGAEQTAAPLYAERFGCFVLVLVVQCFGLSG